MVENINVVFISDNNYIIPVSVAITSLKLHFNKNYTYNIYIICEDMDNDNITMLNELNEENFFIHSINLGKSEYHYLEKKYSKVTSASIQKFNIATILSNLNKVLYLDGDIIIQDDLVNLYETNIESFYCAAVPDGPRKKILNGNKKHKFSIRPNYFNSGVMLLNLSLLRRDNVPEKLMNYRQHGYNYFMDQDAFNVVFGGKVYLLPYYYNVLLHIIMPFWEINSIYELSEFYSMKIVDSYERYLDNGIIIHYTFQKPWKYYDIPQAEKWSFYYYKSPFSAINLCRESYYNKIMKSKTYIFGKIFAFIPIRIYNKYIQFKQLLKK